MWYFSEGTTCIPQRGGAKAPEREAYEKSSEFKNGQRFRAGIEGRISVLFRGRGMKRCLAEGRERFEMWVAAAVLANNLTEDRGLVNTPIVLQTKSRLADPLAGHRPALLPRDQTSVPSEPAAFVTKIAFKSLGE